jgi:hypothetical protein
MPPAGVHKRLDSDSADGAGVIARVARGGSDIGAPRLALRIAKAAEQEGVDDEVAPVVQKLRELYEFTVTTMDEGIGGEYRPASGDVRLNAKVLSVFPGQSLENLAEQMEEIGAHERFHETHHHNPSALRNAYAEGATIVTIGGKEFEPASLIEGMTVYATGDKYVDETYKGYAQDIAYATAVSGWSFQQIVQAVDCGDLSKIDDNK